MAAIRTGLSEAKTLKTFRMKALLIGNLVAKSVLTSVGSPLEELVLEGLGYGEYTGCLCGWVVYAQ